MQEFENVDKKVNDYLYDVTIHKAWLTDYNIRFVKNCQFYWDSPMFFNNNRHNISSPYRINEGIDNFKTPHLYF